MTNERSLRDSGMTIFGMRVMIDDEQPEGTVTVACVDDLRGASPVSRDMIAREAKALRSPGAGAMMELIEAATEYQTATENLRMVGTKACEELQRQANAELTKCLDAIAALPAPDVPAPVRAYAAWVDDCKGMPDDNDVPADNLRSWIMEEYGI